MFTHFVALDNKIVANPKWNINPNLPKHISHVTSSCPDIAKYSSWLRIGKDKKWPLNVFIDKDEKPSSVFVPPVMYFRKNFVFDSTKMPRYAEKFVKDISETIFSPYLHPAGFNVQQLYCPTFDFNQLTKSPFIEIGYTNFNTHDIDHTFKNIRRDFSKIDSSSEEEMEIESDPDPEVSMDTSDISPSSSLDDVSDKLYLLPNTSGTKIKSSKKTVGIACDKDVVEGNTYNPRYSAPLKIPNQESNLENLNNSVESGYLYYASHSEFITCNKPPVLKVFHECKELIFVISEQKQIIKVDHAYPWEPTPTKRTIVIPKGTIYVGSFFINNERIHIKTAKAGGQKTKKKSTKSVQGDQNPTNEETQHPIQGGPDDKYEQTNPEKSSKLLCKFIPISQFIPFEKGTTEFSALLNKKATALDYIESANKFNPYIKNPELTRDSLIKTDSGYKIVPLVMGEKDSLKSYKITTEKTLDIQKLSDSFSFHCLDRFDKITKLGIWTQFASTFNEYTSISLANLLYNIEKLKPENTLLIYKEVFDALNF